MEERNLEIWFRVGMKAKITESEMEILRSTGRDSDELMEKVIERAELSGETYIPARDNGHEDYDNPQTEIDFLF